MRPKAVFIFDQCPGHKTRYKLTEHRGADIPGFPAVWKRGPEAGNKYIGFRETVNHKPGHRRFSHTLELDKGRTVTGLNFAPEYPRQAYGDYKQDGLLIRFSDTGERLTILFFADMKEAAQNLFQLWAVGELSEIPAADTLPLETKKAG
jgi:hypothetical protein